MCLKKDKRNYGVQTMKRVFDKIKCFFNKKPVQVVIIILLLGLIFTMLYFMFIHKDDGKLVYSDYTISAGHVGEIKEFDPSYTVDGYQGDQYRAYYITGKISAKEDKGFTVITFNLYDEKDNLVGTAVAGLNELKKGKTYDFKALSLVENVDVDRVDHYELKSIELGNRK